METPVRLTAADAEITDDGRMNFQIEPYRETVLPGGWVVYHQGDEEQHAIVHPGGQVDLRGPRDWTVTYDPAA